MQLCSVMSEIEDLTISIPLVPCQPSIRAIFCRAVSRDLWCTMELYPYSCNERCSTVKRRKQFLMGVRQLQRGAYVRGIFLTITQKLVLKPKSAEKLIFPASVSALCCIHNHT